MQNAPSNDCQVSRRATPGADGTGDYSHPGGGGCQWGSRREQETECFEAERVLDLSCDGNATYREGGGGLPADRVGREFTRVAAARQACGVEPVSLSSRLPRGYRGDSG